MVALKWSLVVVLVAVHVYYFGSAYLYRKTVEDCNGSVHPLFEEVRQTFRESLRNGKEPGASFSVFYKGQPLVDLWGGYADMEASRQWSRNTLSQGWSITKGISAIAVAMLVDRGHLDYDEYVYKYWPDFGQNEKKNITVAMLLSHQAGLSSLDDKLYIRDYKDNWDTIDAKMARQKPLWPPGQFYSYHAFTWGMYVDALVRKVDPKHRSISQFFREEVAKPYDVDFHIGLPLEESYRSTRAHHLPLWRFFVGTFLLSPDNWDLIPSLFQSDISYRAATAMDVAFDFDVMNDPDIQAIGLPSTNGFGNARSLAQMYDYVANGGIVQGKRLISEKQATALMTSLTGNIPYITMIREPFSVGMVLTTNAQGHRLVGHRGYGGQNAYANIDLNVGIAYLSNFHSDYCDRNDPRMNAVLEATHRCLTKFLALTHNKEN